MNPKFDCTTNFDTICTLFGERIKGFETLIAENKTRGDYTGLRKYWRHELQIAKICYKAILKPNPHYKGVFK